MTSIEELSALCEACGMCCDGSLFGVVRLTPDEKVRLRVVDALALPCASHTTGKGCGIYEERPSACRNFVCTLHDHHRREGGPLGPRIEIVQRVRALIEALRARGHSAFDIDPPESADYAELVWLLERYFSRG